MKFGNFIRSKKLPVVLVTLISLWMSRWGTISWWVNLAMVLLWFGVIKLKPKYSWIFLVFLVLINLNLNRLLNFNGTLWGISFDREQSFWDYPGIRDSILRYKTEGLLFPYQFRKLFYSQYLVFFSYLTGVVKLLSPLFWVRIMGFSGFSLFLLGWIAYFKNGFKNWYVGSWFLVIILSSALRVLGDSMTAVYLTLPAVTIIILNGTKSEFFRKYQFYWWLLFLFDLLIK